MRKLIYITLIFLLVSVLSSLSVIGVSEITDLFISDFANPFSLTQSTPSLINNVSVFNATWLEFNGIDNFVTVSDNDFLSFESNDNNFTILGWFNASNLLQSSLILDKRDGNDDGLRILLNGADDKIYASIDEIDCISDVVIVPKIWNQFAFSVNRSKNATLWINMEKEDTCAINGEAMDIDVNLIIGTQSFGSFGFFNGSIDKIKIFNFTLEREDIRAIFREENRTIGFTSKGIRTKRIPVLQYHCIGDSRVSPNMAQSDFDSQIDYLFENGFNTTTFQDYILHRYGNGTMPKKPAILTFDDGCLGILTNASTKLDEYGFVGVAAIVTNWTNSTVRDEFRLNWTDVSSLISKGWEIASHSVNHTRYTNLNSSQRINDLNVSFNKVKDSVDYNMSTFIFPFNSQNSTLISEARTIYNLTTGTAFPPEVGTFYNYVTRDLTKGLVRIDMPAETTLENFKRRVDLFNLTIFELNLNENNGTIAFDTSGNNNNGTITGATWNNDNNKIVLNNNFDYSITGNQFTLLDEFYNRYYMLADFNCINPFGNTINFTINVCTNLKPFNYTATTNRMKITNINDTAFSLNFSGLPAFNQIFNQTSTTPTAENVNTFTETIPPNNRNLVFSQPNEGNPNPIEIPITITDVTWDLVNNESLDIETTGTGTIGISGGFYNISRLTIRGSNINLKGTTGTIGQT